MFENIRDLAAMKKQADQLKKVLNDEQITGTAADGQVSVTINGNQELLDISIADDLLSPQTKSELQSALKEAWQNTQTQLRQLLAHKMMSGDIQM